MTGPRITDQVALQRLRDFLADQQLALNARLPVERELAGTLGLSRAKLRGALAVLEAEGQIWRHVGRGTFIGPRPILNLNDVEFLTTHTSIREIMEARLAVEPQLARLAALHGTEADFSALRRCNQLSRAARDWRVYEAWDNNFHQAVAAATKNKPLITLFDTLNIVRRSTVWTQRRKSATPPKDHESFDEHEAIYEAIVARDPDKAAACMTAHLKTVRNRIRESLDL